MNAPEHPAPHASKGNPLVNALINPLLAVLVILGLTAWGLKAMFTMPKEKFPDMPIPLAVVIAVYPGAPPDLVEARVTNVLERRLKVLPRLTSLASSTIESASIMVVEFDVNASVEESHRMVAEKIDEARNELPPEVEQILHKRVSVNGAPIIAFNLVGDLEPQDMRRLAQGMQKKLEGIEGVSEIRLSGLRKDELQVLVDRHRLEAIGASLNDVVWSLQASQDEAPIGRLQGDSYNYSLQIPRVGLDLTRLSQLPVRSSTTGQSVPLADLATIKREMSEQKEFARMVQLGDDGFAAETVTMEFMRQPGTDLVALCDTIQERINELRPSLPPNVKLLITMDRSEEVKQSMDLLFENGWQDLLLVMLTLFMFLGVRESLLASLSVPLTFVATFGVLDAMGHTINSLSLMALLVALGILVDNFILALEGMHEHLKEGMSGRQAARATMQLYAVPAASGTATTIASFMPMAMLDGLDGKFITVIPIAVTITLVISLALAMTVNLGVASFWLKRVDEPNKVTAYFDSLVGGWADGYYRFMGKVITTRRQRAMTIGAAVAMLLLSFYVLRFTEQVLYPPSDYPQVGATFYLPPGTSLAETRKLAEQVEATLSKETGLIKHFVLTAGQKSSLAFTRPQAYLEPFRGEHILGVNMELVPVDQREKSWLAAETLRTKLEPLSKGRLEIHQIRMGPSGSAPVEVQVRGDDPQRVRGIAEEISQIMQKTSGLIAVRDNRKEETGSFRIELDDLAMKYHNLSRTQVLMFLRSAIDGKTADTVVENGENVDIRVAYDWRNDGIWNAPDSASELLSMKVSGLFSTASVPLAAIGELVSQTSPSAIDHVDTKHAVLLQAETGGPSPIDLANAIQEQVKGIHLEEGESITMLGDKAKSEQTTKELGGALVLSLVLILVIMLLLFESISQTLIVMSAVPFALIGVFLGFFILGIPFSFPSMVGVVSLGGIVVTNSIILLVTTNLFRTQGMDIIEATRQAGRQRLRPVLNTTLTTVVGLLPMAFTDPIWEGLCMAIVCGLSLSTVLVLVVVPALYVAVEPKLGALGGGED